jgi:hypothetical protein
MINSLKGDECVYCGKKLQRYPYWAHTSIGVYRCDCSGWTKDQEKGLMEEYNKRFNEKLNSRPVTDFIKCPGEKCPPKIEWELKWYRVFEYKFSRWEKIFVNMDKPCSYHHNIRRDRNVTFYETCKICHGTGYLKNGVEHGRPNTNTRA